MVVCSFSRRHTISAFLLFDWGSPVHNELHLSYCFEYFSLCCWLQQLVMICFELKILFEFNLLEVHWASEHVGSCLSSHLGSFWQLFIQVLSPFLSSSSGIPLMHILVFLKMNPSSLRLSSLYSLFFFLFLRLDSFNCLVLEIADYVFAFSNLPLNPLLNFSFIYWFSYSRISIWFPFIICLFVDSLVLVIHCFPDFL